jgi:choline kinase
MVRQLSERGFKEIVIVVGHMHERIIEEMRATAFPIRFVYNPSYATDTNIRSLLLGLESRDEAALIVEADVVFDEPAMDALTAAAAAEESLWFTKGSFQPWQIGGILRSDANRRVTEIFYTPRYERRFEDCKKLLGVLVVGIEEMPRYHALLREAAARSIAQYFMMPWVEHLSSLPCAECDLGDFRTASFNTPDEYRRCLTLFQSDEQKDHAH